MMFPFTWPFSRNIPESCSVPSSETPWSKKPVHSSLALTLPAPLLPPDHFHAMASPDARKDESPIYSRAPFSQSAPPHLVPNRKSPRLCGVIPSAARDLLFHLCLWSAAAR